MKLSRRQFVLTTLASQVSLRATSFSDGAWIQDLHRDKATLVWCGGPGEDLVEWEALGLAKQIARAHATPLPDGRQLWKASLEGLPPNAPVQYRAGVHSGTFSPLGAAGSPLRFLAFGDSGCGSEEQKLLAQRMEAEKADLLLHTGDIAYPASTDAALEELYFGAYRSLLSRLPIYPCPGNHDYIEDLAPYLRWHSIPGGQNSIPAHEGRYYRFEAKGVEFFSLDSNDPLWEGTSMLSWLDARLASSRAFWRIAYFHHPPYTGGKHANDETCRLAAERLAPRLERARIPLVLNGHDHNYQRARSADTTYLITGGGGAWLYEAGPHDRLQKSGNWHHYLRASVAIWKMRVEAIGLAGDILDQIDLAPAPTLLSLTNSANFAPRLAPGALASLFGYHLAANGTADLRLSLDGQNIPLLGALGTQLNFALPAMTPGRKRLRLETPNGASEMEVELLRSAPALFRDSQGRPLTSAPASPGSRLRVYLTGSGGEKVRLRTGQRDLGSFLPLPVPGMPGLEELEITLPSAWEALQVEPVA